MEIPEGFVSNTIVSNTNQTLFTPEYPDGDNEGMVFMKIYRPGENRYLFAFSGTVFTTFGDGSRSRCNDVCPDWTVRSLSAAAVSSCDPYEAGKADFKIIYFGQSESVSIKDGGTYVSDPVSLTVEKNEYLCLKIVFSGEKVPCHEESLIPKFIKTPDGMTACPLLPVPVFTGIERKVNKRVCFIGDSITQGLGTEFNAYRYYAAYIQQILPTQNAYQNLGTGYARGSDAASDGAWLALAKKNSIVTVCFGVNDILQGHSAQRVKNDLLKIVTLLKQAGCTVIMQTVPPFDYDRKNEITWREVNRYILTELSLCADEVFNTVPILSASGDSPVSRYGSHPNGDGHLVWAERLAPVIENYL